MQNKNSRGYDGLEIGFYETCWNELKETFEESTSGSKKEGI